MSAKEGFFVLNSENIVAGDKHKPKVGKSIEVSGSVERKCLADITNMQHQHKPSTLDEKSQFIPASAKEYINELKKENMTLMKLLADRNKIIELSGIELHKLRINLQKMQQQNFQLAQSNSHLLAELNLGKDRLKLLQHELGCKKGLLIIAKGLELEEKEETLPSQKVGKEVEMLNCEETLESSEAVSKNNKSCNMNRRKQSKSLGPSTVKQLEDKKADNKRRCVRRQSARFKFEEPKPAEDLFDADSTSVASGPLHNDQKQEEVSTSTCLLVEKEDNISNNKRLPIRRQSTRFKSEEPKPAEDLFEVDSTRLPPAPLGDCQMQENILSSMCLSVEKEDKIPDSKRRIPVRRQSARFKAEEQKPFEELTEVGSARLTAGIICEDQMQEDVSTSISLSVEKDDKEGKCSPSNQSQDIGRPSIGRPSRQAAKKVNSYKEVPLNVKMRRTE